MKRRKYVAGLSLLLVLCLLIPTTASGADSAEEKSGNPWLGLFPFLLTGGFPEENSGPLIDRIELEKTSRGNILTVFGSDFSSNPNKNTPIFSAAGSKSKVPGEVISASGNKLKVKMPDQATTGPLFVDVNGNWSNKVQLGSASVQETDTTEESTSSLSNDSGGIPWFGAIPWLLTGGLNSNEPPEVEISADPTSGTAPLEVSFDASDSSDLDGKIVSYKWNFDDGNTDKGEAVTHGFGAAGEYTVKLTVVDEIGAKSTSNISIEVNKPKVKTKEKAFSLDKGTEFDTGFGLSISIPSSSKDNAGSVKASKERNEYTIKASKITDPTQPKSSVLQLDAVYRISLLAGNASKKENSWKKNEGMPLANNLTEEKVKLRFSNPVSKEGYTPVILDWTKEGYRLVPPEKTGEMKLIGGTPTQNYQYIETSVNANSLSTPAVVEEGGSIFSIGFIKTGINYIKNAFDISPVYPSIKKEATETKGKFKIPLWSPKEGFGGVWFRVDVDKISGKLETDWDPGNEEFDLDFLDPTKNRYLAPTREEKKGILTLNFKTEGSAWVEVNAREALFIQIADWLEEMPVPGAGISIAAWKGINDVLHSACENIKGELEKEDTDWSRVIEETRQLQTDLRIEIGKSLVDEGLKDVIGRKLLVPTNLLALLANEAKYMMTIQFSKGNCNKGICERKIKYTTKNRSPNATITSVKPEIEIYKKGQEIIFNGKASDPEDGELADDLLVWTSNKDGQLGTGKEITVDSLSVGTHKITLKATDSDGATDTDQRNVAIRKKPDLTVTSVSLSDSSIQVGSTISVEFTIENLGGSLSKEFQNRIYFSEEPDGGGQIPYEPETFNMPLEDQSKKTRTREITVPSLPKGEWYLNVYTDGGKSIDESKEGNNIDSSEIKIEGTENDPPNASFTASDTSGTAPMDVSFDASGSSDPDGHIESHDWNFDDGSSSSGETTSHEFGSSGNYTVELTVTDDDGDTDSTSKAISVSSPTNDPPNASFTASDTSGTAPMDVSFDASGSSDPDGHIESHDWNFDDGDTASGKTTSHTFDSAGSFTVSLTVKDNDGATDSVTKTISVQDSTVTLTLYVHEGSSDGPIISGARVTGQDADGVSFDKTTNSSGYVTITGAPGTWSFTADADGYNSESWSQSITSTQTRNAYLQLQPPTITSPGDSSEPGPEINDLTPTLQWNGVASADEYGLSISEYPYGSSNIIYDKYVTGTSHTVLSGYLESGKKYRWNMKTYTDAGYSSGVSNTLYFQTKSEPTDLIDNGSFSSGESNWNLSGDFWAGTTLSSYRTSPGYSAGGVDSDGYHKNDARGKMYQTVTIPSGISTATLKLWYNITSDEPSSSNEDILQVTLRDTSDNYLTYVRTLDSSNQSTLGDYSQVSKDISSYAGQTIRINFQVATDGTNPTTFRFDDVSLIVEG